MKNKMLFCIALFATISIIYSSCKSTEKIDFLNEPNWVNIAVVNGVEIFVDSASIKQKEGIVYAREKRIYVSAESRTQYVDRIRTAYKKLNNPKQSEKWNNFSYCIYTCLYECTNKRFRILSVQDYSENNELISITRTPENKIQWIDVDPETVGDYTFFYVCDNVE